MAVMRTQNPTVPRTEKLAISRTENQAVPRAAQLAVPRTENRPPSGQGNRSLCELAAVSSQRERVEVRGPFTATRLEGVMEFGPFCFPLCGARVGGFPIMPDPVLGDALCR